MIEALVALSVIAISLAAIGSLVASNVRATRRIDDRLAVVETARAALTGLPDRSSLALGNFCGDIGDNHWRVDVMPFQADFVDPARAINGCRKLSSSGWSRPRVRSCVWTPSGSGLSRGPAVTPATDGAANAGFTLVEALVATLLMGVILAALATVTGQWIPSWNRGLAGLRGTELAAEGLDRLAGDLAEVNSSRQDPAMVLRSLTAPNFQLFSFAPDSHPTVVPASRLSALPKQARKTVLLWCAARRRSRSDLTNRRTALT